MLKKISGIRLQPIVQLTNDKIIGYEILSKIKFNANVEGFFHALTERNYEILLLKQLDVIRESGVKKKLFVNIPLAILLKKRGLELFLYQCTGQEKNINVEIQDAFLMEKMTSLQMLKLKKIISIMRVKGYSIWFDDYRDGMDKWLDTSQIIFDGIKTDYRELRRWKKNSLTMKPLIDKAKKFSKSVLIEGIETESDWLYACDSGADLGQGFMWPEDVILTTIV
ncbi:EAL domain-containing protein [Pantoea ananatis]|uniref:EAL domain-containing protein n=1 Tax=Pantoea ananas TaxID=553 RepID=UPI0024B7DB54|nr:EAL domain-containing protein [Pantoea ananatis]MDJ0043313.1 EAL domain-containing protein [Pantoea ananatis]